MLRTGIDHVHDKPINSRASKTEILTAQHAVVKTAMILCLVNGVDVAVCSVTSAVSAPRSVFVMTLMA